MPDLLAGDEAEVLPLPDADLQWWRQPELGSPADRLFTRLLAEADWRQHRVTLFGKTHPQPRLCAWYGDVGYAYSGTRHEPAPWTPTLAMLRRRIEILTGEAFNSVLLNYYRDGRDCMGMHSDDEPELGDRPAIASLSLGESRDFVMRHRFDKALGSFKLALPSGSLLLMRGETQRFWRHGINRVSRPCGARINLTFRKVFDGGIGV